MRSWSLLLCVLFQVGVQPTVKYSVGGVLLDSEGHPVTSAIITAVPWHTSGRALEVVTGKDGQFLLQGASSGTYRCFFLKEAAGVPDTRALIFEDPEKKSFQEVNIPKDVVVGPVVLRMPKPYGQVNGFVYDERTKLPLQRARLRLERANDASVMYETGIPEDGRFTIRLPHVPIRMFIKSAGYETWVYQNDTGKAEINLDSVKVVDIKVPLRKQ